MAVRGRSSVVIAFLVVPAFALSRLATSWSDAEYSAGAAGLLAAIVAVGLPRTARARRRLRRHRDA